MKPKPELEKYLIGFTGLLFNDDENVVNPLFVKTLGQGSQGAAQLVRLPGGTAVRKIHRPPSENKHRNVGETTVARYLQANAQLNDPNDREPPLFTHLVQDNELRIDGPNGEELWTRETYWKFYNAGTAALTFWGHEEDFIAPPIPFIAHYMKQLCATVYFFRYGNPNPEDPEHGPKVVYHGDLHMNNVFLHWDAESGLPDAYVGDFGSAQIFDAPNVREESNDVERLLEQFEILIKVSFEDPNVESMKRLYAVYEVLEGLAEQSRHRILTAAEWQDLIQRLDDVLTFTYTTTDIAAMRRVLLPWGARAHEAANTKQARVRAKTAAKARKAVEKVKPEIFGPWWLVQHNGRLNSYEYPAVELVPGEPQQPGGVEILFHGAKDKKAPKKIRAAHERHREARRAWKDNGGPGPDSDDDMMDYDAADVWDDDEDGENVDEEDGGGGGGFPAPRSDLRDEYRRRYEQFVGDLQAGSGAVAANGVTVTGNSGPARPRLNGDDDDDLDLFPPVRIKTEKVTPTGFDDELEFIASRPLPRGRSTATQTDGTRIRGTQTKATQTTAIRSFGTQTKPSHGGWVPATPASSSRKRKTQNDESESDEEEEVDVIHIMADDDEEERPAKTTKKSPAKKTPAKKPPTKKAPAKKSAAPHGKKTQPAKTKTSASKAASKPATNSRKRKARDEESEEDSSNDEFKDEEDFFNEEIKDEEEDEEDFSDNNEQIKHEEIKDEEIKDEKEEDEEDDEIKDEEDSSDHNQEIKDEEEDEEEDEEDKEIKGKEDFSDNDEEIKDDENLSDEEIKGEEGFSDDEIEGEEDSPDESPVRKKIPLNPKLTSGPGSKFKKPPKTPSPARGPSGKVVPASPAKRTPAKKAPAKKAPAPSSSEPEGEESDEEPPTKKRKTAAKPVPAKKPPAKKAPAKKAPAPSSSPLSSPLSSPPPSSSDEEPPAKKRKTTGKPPAKKPPAKKAPAKKAPAKKDPTRRTRTAADWAPAVGPEQSNPPNRHGPNCVVRRRGKSCDVCDGKQNIGLPY